MSARERFSHVQEKAKRFGNDVANAVAVTAALPIVAGLAFRETWLGSEDIVDFEPLEVGGSQYPQELADGEIFLPYGATAKVIFEKDGEIIEGLILDMKDSSGQASGRRRNAGSILRWGERVEARRGDRGRWYAVLGQIGSVSLESNGRVEVDIPELAATLIHDRPQRPSK